MSVRSGQSITTVFTTTRFDTGAATNGDSTPTGTLYVNGTADAATVTITNLATGVYKAAVTLPTLAVGDVVNVVIAATVNSVAGKGKVWEDTKDIVIDSAGLADATAVKIGPSGSATGQTARDIGAETDMLLAGVTVSDKTGFSLAATGLDAISVADPGAPSAMTTLPRMLVAIWRSVFKKKTLTSSAAKFFADDGSTANATSVVSDDGTTQQWGSMS